MSAWTAASCAPLPQALRIPGGAFIATLRVDGARLSTGVDHVNNVEYVAWVDELAALHAADLGHGRPAMLGAGRMWFVARHELDYRAECFPGDQLLGATWLERVEGARAWRRTVIWKSPELVVIKALTAWALVDLASRRPLPLRGVPGASAINEI